MNMEKIIKLLKEEVSKLRGYAVIIDGEDGEWEPVTTVSMEDIYEIINQLDELEVLSGEWIDEHSNGPSRSQYVWVDDLKELLVPKQELPAIPKFVAEYLDFAKGDVSLMRVMELASIRNKLPKWKKEYDWISANGEKFAKAWLYGFTVETEQKYYVMNNDNRMMLVRMMDGKTITEADPFKLEDMYEGEKESHRLTEQEIKDYDPRYWAFRKPVEELEE